MFVPSIPLASQIPQTSEAATKALTNEDIITMVSAGLNEEIITATIKSSVCSFDTAPDVLKELKNGNVPDSVILAMVQAPVPSKVPISTKDVLRTATVQCGIGGGEVSLLVAPETAFQMSTLKCDQRISILNDKTAWYFVRTDDGKAGYISHYYVKEAPGFVGVYVSKPSSSTEMKAETQNTKSQVPEVPKEVFQQEIVYVECAFGEVGIHAASSTNPNEPAASKTVATVKCGDTVTSIGEAGGGFRKVRTKHGVVGFIATGFLSRTKPVASDAPATTEKKGNTMECGAPHCIFELQVVETQTSQRQFTTTIPGTAGTSETRCNTNGNDSVYGTSNGGTVNGTIRTNSSTNCTTTSEPGTPPTSFDESIAQEYVRVIWPSGLHSTLWCQAGFRHCFALAPGTYAAEPRFDRGGHLNAVWIYTDGQGGKVNKIKYTPVGGW
jgi:hypothetical protein